MSPEEKIKYIPEWIEYWASCEIAKIRRMDLAIRIFNETGCFISESLVLHIEFPLDQFIEFKTMVYPWLKNELK